MLVDAIHNPPATAMETTRRDYGSAMQTVRGRGAGIRDYSFSSSGSCSGERLRSVPEDDDGCGPSAWNGGEDGDDEDGDEEYSEHEYRRAVRLYAIVPLGSAFFFLITLFIPNLIASSPRPTSPSPSHLLLTALLSAALWCLAHALRIPLHTLLRSTLTSFATLLTNTFRSTQTHAYITLTLTTSILHVLTIAALSELLHIASFAILNLHWSRPQPQAGGLRAHDATFREVWALAMGWALAEVCAGVVQGYEQLALYAPTSNTKSPERERVPAVSRNQKVGGGRVLEEGRVRDDEAVGLVRRSMSWADEDEARVLIRGDIGEALEELVDVRARDEIEELYGEPYIDIPVFVALLQRLDSLLLSLGITLLLAAAYLPNPSSPSPSFSNTSSLVQRHPHTLPLPTTFLALTLVHAFLGALHAPPALPYIGLPAAAYASCVVGLALTFAGVGVWVGVW